MKCLLPVLLFVVLLLVQPLVRANAMTPDASSDDISSLRAELYKKYGIQALDKTDKTAPVVLENLLLILNNAFFPKVVRSLGHFRYLFAYEGHDDHYNIAAYHLDAKAISIGGLLTYSGKKEGPQIQILSALAHEIGHAFLMEKISPSELKDISEEYGGWASVFRGKSIHGLFSRAFFLHHSLYYKSKEDGEITSLYVNLPQWKKNNLTSGYAEENVHEWFADAFAAFILNRLGNKNLLGKNWKKELIVLPNEAGDYWVNYGNLSAGFRQWLERKIDEEGKAPS